MTCLLALVLIVSLELGLAILAIPKSISLSILSVQVIIARRLIGEKKHLNWSRSYIEGIVSYNASLDELVRFGTIQDESWGCLSDTDRAGHSRNAWKHVGETILRSSEYVRGSTFWVNEHQAVGHARFDIQIIQALQSLHVDRIVLQRAPCVTSDLCKGKGTYLTFFQGFYASMIQAFRPGIPLLMRFHNTNRLEAHYLSINGSVVVDKIVESDALMLRHNSLCFERLIRRCYSGPNNGDFPPLISPRAAQEFKETSFTLVPPLTPRTRHRGDAADAQHPIVINYAYRDTTNTRHAANPSILSKILQDSFLPPTFLVRSLSTANVSQSYQDQMRLAGESDILITEHGAFQSNIIYMRNGSLMIDLRGDYEDMKMHSDGVANVAQNFLVYLKHVTTANLTSHETTEFFISESEARQVVDIIDSYCVDVLGVTPQH